MTLVHGVKPTAKGMRSVAASVHMLNAHRTIPIFRPTTACVRVENTAARLRASSVASARHIGARSVAGGAIAERVPQEPTERRHRIRAAADNHHTVTASIGAKGAHMASVRGEASHLHMGSVSIVMMPSRDLKAGSRVSAAATVLSVELRARSSGASLIAAADHLSGVIVTMEAAALQTAAHAVNSHPNVRTVPVTDRSVIRSTPRRRCLTRCV